MILLQATPASAIIDSIMKRLSPQRASLWPGWIWGLVACAPELTVRGQQSLVLREGTDQQARETGWLLVAQDADTPPDQMI